jgi:hypothetical protein
MVVKFFRPKHALAAAKRRNKKVVVGTLVGSKTYHNTDVREEDDDEDVQEFDNVSALELALNHSDTVGVNESDTKKVHNFGILPNMMKRRKSVQSAQPSNTSTPKLRSILEEKRDDCTDEQTSSTSHGGIVKKSSVGAISGSKTADQSTKSSSNQVPVHTSLLVSVTPESLTGLIFKGFPQTIKSPNKKVDKSDHGMKIKGYLRVVRKGAGVKIVSGSPKIVKSYRLGSTTVTNINSNNSILIWSNEATGIKSTGSLSIRVPAVQTINSNSSYNQLTFEIGIITPEGIFPLGTTTYQPVVNTANEDHQKIILKVDPMHKGSLFQRRKGMMTVSSVASKMINDKEPCCRLQRRSNLSLIIEAKPMSEKVYILLKQKKDLERSSKMVDALPKSLSSPMGVQNQESGYDNVPIDGTIPTELQKIQSEPTSGIITYLSDPLSCCSDRDVDSDVEAEEVIPDDAKTQATDPSTYKAIDDDTAQVQLSKIDLTDLEPIHEDKLYRTIDSENDTPIEDSTWCFLFPICCCVGNNSRSVQNVPTTSADIDNNALITNTKDIELSAIPTSNTMVYDAVVQQAYVDKETTVNEKDSIVNEKIDTSRHRFSEEINDILQSHSYADTQQDKSIIASRNCCMVCFGDEDVENLRYSRLRQIEESTDILNKNAINDDIQKKNAINDDTQVDTVDQTDVVDPLMVNQDEVNDGTQVSPPDESGSLLNIGSDNAVVEEKVDNYKKSQTISRLDAVLDTMSSSYTEDHDDDSAYSVAYSDDLDVEVGCFHWMGALSYDGAESLRSQSMSVISSDSHVDSLAGMAEVASDKIPISKSADTPAFSPIPDVKHKLQSNSIS